MAWKSVKLVDANSNEVYSYHTDNITGFLRSAPHTVLKNHLKICMVVTR
ncbi:hypothetical protein KNT59_gp100 [Klebsiella phage KPV15]|uniref:Uncharacterized protein n=1 Tax=Klebsiella phage KPV15 TaxID=1913572 RepID=A0A1J0MH10_9CAUD|nr:hypothetical protein KNT59_gp100 [Klebsiella phage KPV15]APD20456.1 hypothetical protein [Klebsiella phage KPV15]